MDNAEPSKLSIEVKVESLGYSILSLARRMEYMQASINKLDKLLYELMEKKDG